ncbi:MAG: hypothetical protein ACLU0O_12425 [Collinsella sp.]
MDKLDAMTAQVRDFCDARDWRKYTPKELAIGRQPNPQNSFSSFVLSATSALPKCSKTPSNAKPSKMKLPTHSFPPAFR